MLQTVDVGVASIGDYESIVGSDRIYELRGLAEKLHGARILHLNATPYGGGVSELLRSELPLLRDLGLDADWKVIFGDQEFFKVTKSFHNALQGSDLILDENMKEIYLDCNIRNARLLEEKYDYIIIHDPQPIALLHFKGKGDSKWIWRCHIDTSEPHGEAWDFLNSFTPEYNAAIFTMEGFIPPKLQIDKVFVIPPAVDPLSPKNMDISPALCREVLSWIGVDLRRPLMIQVSRFDPWKDPEGVIDVYRMVREDMPNLQLALVGSMALDDPEAWQLYSRIMEYGKSDPNAYVFTNLNGVSNIEVNAFQRMANVVIQKSIREGFGLVVSETLWKGTPIVAGKTGGIPLQVENGVSGYLCESDEEYAQRISYLLHNQREAKEMAEHGKEGVKEQYLLPRLIKDELNCLCSL